MFKVIKKNKNARIFSRKNSGKTINKIEGTIGLFHNSSLTLREFYFFCISQIKTIKNNECLF